MTLSRTFRSNNNYSGGLFQLSYYSLHHTLLRNTVFGACERFYMCTARGGSPAFTEINIKRKEKNLNALHTYLFTSSYNRT